MDAQRSGQPAPSGVAVRVRDLQKSFNGDPVLRGVNFEVAKGEVFVLMGSSGSGKTVLLKHLIGLESADRGAVEINGEKLGSDRKPRSFRSAMVFQSGGLLHSLNVEENVGLYLLEHRLHPRDEIRRIVKEKLKAVGLEGVETRAVSELSGGMRKRAAIARALTMNPQLILYDEPTSELDPETAVLIGNEIRRLNRDTGATSIIVSHDKDLAFGVADRIAVISKGEIVCVGSPEDVRRHPDPIVRNILDAEYGEDF